MSGPYVVGLLDVKVYNVNLRSDFSRFIDTGYFSCAFGLLFYYGLLPLDFWVFHTNHFCFISAEKRYQFNF